MKMRSLAPLAAAAAFVLLPTSSQAGHRDDDCFRWMRSHDWFGWMREVRVHDTKRVDDCLFGWLRHDRKYR